MSYDVSTPRNSLGITKLIKMAQAASLDTGPKSSSHNVPHRNTVTTSKLDVSMSVLAFDVTTMLRSGGLGLCFRDLQRGNQSVEGKI